MPDQSVHPEAARLYAGAFGPWTWKDPSRGEHFRRCSYCGSINPEDLAAEPVWRASWADRKYGWPHKFYVDIPNRDPDALFITSAINFDPKPEELARGNWIAFGDLTEAQKKILVRDGWGPREGDGFEHKYVQFGKHPNHWGKFYTIHLKDSELAPEVKVAIENKSGIGFDFTDDKVSWHGPLPCNGHSH